MLIYFVLWSWIFDPCQYMNFVRMFKISKMTEWFLKWNINCLPFRNTRVRHWFLVGSYCLTLCFMMYQYWLFSPFHLAIVLSVLVASDYSLGQYFLGTVQWLFRQRWIQFAVLKKKQQLSIHFPIRLYYIHLISYFRSEQIT